MVKSVTPSKPRLPVTCRGIIPHVFFGRSLPATHGRRHGLDTMAVQILKQAKTLHQFRKVAAPRFVMFSYPGRAAQGKLQDKAGARARTSMVKPFFSAVGRPRGGTWGKLFS